MSKQLEGYEHALACFILDKWFVAKIEYYSCGLDANYRATVDALDDIRAHGVRSIKDPHQEYGSVFAGTFNDPQTYVYSNSEIVSGSGNKYTFSAEYSDTTISEAIKAVLQYANTNLKDLINTRVQKLKDQLDKNPWLDRSYRQ
jgi:hypothetical protein